MATPEPSTFQDTAADVVAIIVLIIVPVIAIAVFWLVHIIPEKIAEKRHHPQKEAIKVLCLLSLVFGGLLWPLAWLWAYSKPVLHKMAYGRDKHEDYYLEHEGLEREGAERERLSDLEQADPAALRAEIESLRLQVQALAERSTPTSELQPVTQRLDALQRAVDARNVTEGRH